MVKYTLKVAPVVEAMRFQNVADFNTMLSAWGERFQAEADIAMISKTIKIYTPTGLLLARIGDWVVSSPGSFDVLSHATFTAIYQPA